MANQTSTPSAFNPKPSIQQPYSPFSARTETPRSNPGPQWPKPGQCDSSGSGFPFTPSIRKEGLQVTAGGVKEVGAGAPFAAASSTQQKKIGFAIGPPNSERDEVTQIVHAYPKMKFSPKGPISHPSQPSSDDPYAASTTPPLPQWPENKNPAPISPAVGIKGALISASPADSPFKPTIPGPFQKPITTPPFCSSVPLPPGSSSAAPGFFNPSPFAHGSKVSFPVASQPVSAARYASEGPKPSGVDSESFQLTTEITGRNTAPAVISRPPPPLPSPQKPVENAESGDKQIPVITSAPVFPSSTARSGTNTFKPSFVAPFQSPKSEANPEVTTTLAEPGKEFSMVEVGQTPYKLPKAQFPLQTTQPISQPFSDSYPASDQQPKPATTQASTSQMPWKPAQPSPFQTKPGPIHYPIPAFVPKEGFATSPLQNPAITAPSIFNYFSKPAQPPPFTPLQNPQISAPVVPPPTPFTLPQDQPKPAALFQPKSVAPFQPKSAAPFQPNSAAPFQPNSAAPFQPESAAPFQPKSATPFQPKSATPFQPNSAAPFQPKSATPFQPESAAPFQPKSATPFQPKSATPFQPNSAAPFQPKSATPFQPESAAPFQPKSATPFQPKSATPFQPNSAAPFQPKSATPFQPNSAAPFQPKSATPFQPESAAPFQPKSATPFQPKSATPFQPNSAAPFQPKSATPFQPNSATPFQPKSATPFQPESAAPFQPKPTIPSPLNPPTPSTQKPAFPFQQKPAFLPKATVETSASQPSGQTPVFTPPTIPEVPAKPSFPQFPPKQSFPVSTPANLPTLPTAPSEKPKFIPFSAPQETQAAQGNQMSGGGSPLYVEPMAGKGGVQEKSPFPPVPGYPKSCAQPSQSQNPTPFNRKIGAWNPPPSTTPTDPLQAQPSPAPFTSKQSFLPKNEARGQVPGAVMRETGGVGGQSRSGGPLPQFNGGFQPSGGAQQASSALAQESPQSNPKPSPFKPIFKPNFQPNFKPNFQPAPVSKDYSYLQCQHCKAKVEGDFVYNRELCAQQCVVCVNCIVLSVWNGGKECLGCRRELSEDEVERIIAKAREVS